MEDGSDECCLMTFFGQTRSRFKTRIAGCGVTCSNAGIFILIKSHQLQTTLSSISGKIEQGLEVGYVGVSGEGIGEQLIVEAKNQRRKYAGHWHLNKTNGISRGEGIQISII